MRGLAQLKILYKLHQIQKSSPFCSGGFFIMEEFRDVVSYEGLYQVSNLGRVKSLRFNKEKILKGTKGFHGYITVSLFKNKQRKTKKVHQIVAESFLNHRSCGLELVVNHKNFNKQDNRVDNLEVVTQRQNTNQKHIKSSSRYIGVDLHKKSNKWRSCIWINGRQVYLGLFDKEIDASKAYKRKLHEIKKVC